MYLGFPTKSDTNQAVQPQKMAKGWKFLHMQKAGAQIIKGYIDCDKHIKLIELPQQNMSSGVSDQVRHKLVCAVMEDGQRLEIRDCTICVVKTNMLISCTGTIQLICPFVLHIQKAGFLMTRLYSS